MSNDPILARILSDTFTVNDLNKRVRALKNKLLKKLFSTQEGEVYENNQAEEIWLKNLGDDFYAQFTQQNVYKIFETLEKEMKSLNSLIMYFPFESNQNQINQIGTYLRKNYGDNFLFDIKYDPQLIGGCAIVWKGIYKDYSLRANIAQNSQKILESFKQAISSRV